MRTYKTIKLDIERKERQVESITDDLCNLEEEYKKAVCDFIIDNDLLYKTRWKRRGSYIYYPYVLTKSKCNNAFKKFVSDISKIHSYPIADGVCLKFYDRNISMQGSDSDIIKFSVFNDIIITSSNRTQEKKDIKKKIKYYKDKLDKVVKEEKTEKEKFKKQKKEYKKKLNERTPWFVEK